MRNLIGDGAVVREWSAHDEWCGFSLESGPCDCGTEKHNAAIRQQAAEIERLTREVATSKAIRLELVEGMRVASESFGKARIAQLASEARADDLLKALDDIANGMVPGEILNPALDAFGATGDKLPFKEMMVTWLQNRARAAIAAAKGETVL